MQPSNRQYPQAPLTPNPYAQIPQVPIVAPKAGRGVSLGVIISLIITIILLLGAIGFGAWAYMSRQDYKDNVDKKITAAVDVATKKEDATKDAQFAEQEKKPFKQYKSPATYGAINITYPKTWSAYVTEASATQSSTFPVDGYFHPNFVPGLQSGTDFALHVQVLSQSYTNVVKQFDGLVKSGKVTASPYTAPKMPGIVGTRVDGAFMLDKQGSKGSLIILPLRDKTIEISTQSNSFLNDLNNTILANLTFEP